MCKQKPVVLVLVGYYLPGYKAGGPLRTIKHIVEHLSEDYTFKIITRDRDLGDSVPYSTVKINQWTETQESQVYYLGPEFLSVTSISKLIKATYHDVLYLNSFFDPIFTLTPLLGMKLNLFKSNKVILAPRGEFSPEALKIKSVKKKVWLLLAKFSGVYKKVLFHASSGLEERDIRKTPLFRKYKILIALDLPSKTLIDISEYRGKKEEDSVDEKLKLVFLSRISPMKNLDYALNILKSIQRDVVFDIFGPIEDAKYWDECKNIISNLPDNVEVQYKKSVIASQVTTTLAKYDLFFLPSRGENYGHVIAESLSAGTPVLLSNNTPWINLKKNGFGWDIGLEKKADFVDVINNFQIRVDDIERKKIRKRLVERLENSGDIQTNKKLFSIL